MKCKNKSLLLCASLLFLAGCSSVPLSQTENSSAERQGIPNTSAAGRLYTPLAPGCVSKEEYNFLTGIWDSGQNSFALQIPLCSKTKSLLPKNTLTVYGVDTQEEPHADAEDHELHTYAGFTLCYRESYEQAEWVAYFLTKERLEQKVIGRTNDFRADTLISTGSATPADYKGSGYDRGHLAPAADMEWSAKTAHDSFLMSNMSPQAPAFNRGTWKYLEEQVRVWALQFERLYVVTGPVLEKHAADYDHIGENQVAVPEYYYKALLAFVPVCKEGGEEETEAYRVQCAAFIMPNRGAGKNIYKFICTIDQAEERTGLDFFSNLPDEVEALVESECGEVFRGP